MLGTLGGARAHRTVARWISTGTNGVIHFISLHKRTLESLGHRAFVFTWGRPAPELEAYAQDLGLAGRVRLVGEIAHDRAPQIIALVDLFVTASRIEVLPRSVIEALAAGLPIVSVDTPWIRQLVDSRTNGFLADPQVSDLAQAWARLVEDPALRARLAQGAVAASEGYSVRRTTERTVAIYRRLVEGASIDGRE
jgi:glycosyltransferase involved in cell wall biosynthesis